MTDVGMGRDTHREEVEGGGRFSFGQNWDRYVKLVNDQRIEVAIDAISELLGRRDLTGLRFLDVGSGSGIHSLAARRMGATVYSFDYDPQSVATTTSLMAMFSPDDPQWTVTTGSVLDSEFIGSLGEFDIVYSWGVLHHTGAMWEAMDKILPTVARGGTLVLAIYNDQNWRSKVWAKVKKFYCSGFLGRVIVTGIGISYFAVQGFVYDLLMSSNHIKRYTEYFQPRGMSIIRDWIDWLGGYPFEVAKPESVFQFYRQRGFMLQNMVTQGGNMGCNEFVFQREV